MASRLLNPTFFHLHAPLFAAGLAGSTLLLFPNVLQSYRQSHLLRLDSSPVVTSPKDWSVSQYQHDAQTPVVKSNGGLNARAVRQMSLGSILGLVAGLGLSVFSKPLVLLIGLAIAGVQTAESYGIHLVPYQRIQKYVKGVDARSAVQDNVALKVSFGLMFALTGFTEF